jgi:crotonobetainyl-CoA:carnitine CoA-transferase CaiB-like acyl-CoA transferase
VSRACLARGPDRPAARRQRKIGEMAAGVLAGTTVLDLTRVMSGPYCTLMLADMGARVIKIEHPQRGDDTRAWGPPFVNGESVYFLSVNRNKESITLDFKQPEGRRILDGLLERGDVLVENFRPGTLARLGLDYGALAARYPRLIYASISGYGQTGPLRDLPGYDAVAQAEGGLMSLTGDPEGPPYRLGLPVADLVAGLFATQAILLALLTRTVSGRGQHVDIAMHDSVAALLTYQAAGYLNTGKNPPRMGNAHESIVPYGTFDVRDGLLMLAVGNDEQFRRFCEAIGLAALAADPRFATNPERVAHRHVLLPLLAPVLSTRTREEWVRVLRDAGVPCGAVRTIGEMMADPQLAARDMIVSVSHPTAGELRLVGNPVKLSEPVGHADRAAPALGEHTESILTHELGLKAREVEDLRRRGVV